jgi:hypothetical protein
MRTPLLLAVLLPLLGGCAGLTADRLPVCDGQARHPANPYGSVLLPPAPAAPEPTADPMDSTASPTDGATGGCA